MPTMVDLTDMVQNTPELEPVESGEYELELQRASIKEGTDKNGNPYQQLQSIHRILGEDGNPLEGAESVFVSTFLPIDSQDADQKARAVKGFRIFCDAHGVDYSFDLDELAGRRAFAILGEDEYEGVPKNVVKKWQVPK